MPLKRVCSCVYPPIVICIAMMCMSNFYLINSWFCRIGSNHHWPAGLSVWTSQQIFLGNVVACPIQVGAEAVQSLWLSQVSGLAPSDTPEPLFWVKRWRCDPLALSPLLRKLLRRPLSLYWIDGMAKDLGGITNQSVMAPSTLPLRPNQATRRNEIIKSYLQLGSSSNRYAPRLPQQETKSSTKQLAPTDPILGPENLLKTGFAQKGLPSCPSGRHKPQNFIETKSLHFCNLDTKNFKKWT